MPNYYLHTWKSSEMGNFRMNSSKVFSVPLQHKFEWSSTFAIHQLNIDQAVESWNRTIRPNAWLNSWNVLCSPFAFSYLKKKEQLKFTTNWFNISGPYVRRICIFATISNSKYFFFFDLWCCLVGIHKIFQLIRIACRMPQFPEHSLRQIRKPFRMRYYRNQSEIYILSMFNVYSWKLWVILCCGRKWITKNDKIICIFEQQYYQTNSKNKCQNYWVLKFFQKIFFFYNILPSVSFAICHSKNDEFVWLNDTYIWTWVFSSS